MLSAASNTSLFPAFSDLIQRPHDYAQRHAQPPSQLSTQSCRNSEDDDERMKMLLASANDEGERQITCVVSFHREEIVHTCITSL